MAKLVAVTDWGKTGLSEAIYLPLRHLHDLGHEIWHLAFGFNGHRDKLSLEEIPWRDRVCRSLDFGQTSLPALVEEVRPDLVISSLDCWMVAHLAGVRPSFASTGVSMTDHDWDLINGPTRSFRHIEYYPMDGLVANRTYPPEVSDLVERFDVAVTYSRFSQVGLKNTNGMDVPFIPIAHDPAVFHPMDRAECRAKLGIPEHAFVVGMVATNQYRKRWDEFLAGCAMFAKGKDDVLIVPWTTWDKQILGGYPIHEICTKLGLDVSPGGNVLHPGDYPGRMTDEGMAALYNAMDICVLTTLGEGAGLPPIRARACGIPALVSDNTSNTEFAGHPLELLKCEIDPLFENNETWNPWHLQRYRTSVNMLRDRLNRLYGDRAQLAEVARRAQEHVRQFEKDKIMPQWESLVNKVLDASDH